jgi:hypothetical protein
MGQWGFYDDEGDSVQDLISFLNDMTLPTKLLNLPLYNETKISKNRFNLTSTKEHEENGKKRDAWMASHLMLIQRNFKKFITENKSYNQDYYFAGLAFFMASGWGTKSHKSVKKLPLNFPEWLRKKALQASNNLLYEVTHFNEMEWKNVKERKQALKHQIKLFS